MKQECFHDCVCVVCNVGWKEERMLVRLYGSMGGRINDSNGRKEDNDKEGRAKWEDVKLLYNRIKRKRNQCYLQCSECTTMALTMVPNYCTKSCTLIGIIVIKDHHYIVVSWIGNGETTQELVDLFTKDG